MAKIGGQVSRIITARPTSTSNTMEVLCTYGYADVIGPPASRITSRPETLRA